MALSADKARQFGVISPNDVNTIPLAASAQVYQGSIIGNNGAGYGRALTAGDKFLGIVHNDGVLNGSTAGGSSCNVIARGVLKNIAVTGASAAADLGRLVYASDDDTLTLTAGANTLVGRITRYDSDSGYFDVLFSSEVA